MSHLARRRLSLCAAISLVACLDTSTTAVVPRPSSGSFDVRSAGTADVRLVPTNGGQTVYDRALNVTWLADANLASTQAFHIPNINLDGSMDYRAAIEWVDSLNAFNHAAGYLGHTDWSLPTTPLIDTTCSSFNNGSFGFNCTNSAMGSLYRYGFGLHQPNTAVRIPPTALGPFTNIQPYLYWSSSHSTNNPKIKNGFISFSFNNGFMGSNVAPNFLYVWPMIQGKLPGTPPAVGTGLQVNPGGQTVYDPIANVTWLADANFAATHPLGVTGINADGSMTHTTADLFITAMNSVELGAGYLHQTGWALAPSAASDANCSIQLSFGFGCTASVMGELYYGQFHLNPGDPAVATPNINVGPFHNLQPYLYWACQSPTAPTPCQAKGPAPGFGWSFSFGSGFEGTDVVQNNLYAMVYFPGP